MDRKPERPTDIPHRDRDARRARAIDQISDAAQLSADRSGMLERAEPMETESGLLVAHKRKREEGHSGGANDPGHSQKEDAESPAKRQKPTPDSGNNGCQGGGRGDEDEKRDGRVGACAEHRRKGRHNPRRNNNNKPKERKRIFFPSPPPHLLPLKHSPP